MPAIIFPIHATGYIMEIAERLNFLFAIDDEDFDWYAVAYAQYAFLLVAMLGFPLTWAPLVALLRIPELIWWAALMAWDFVRVALDLLLAPHNRLMPVRLGDLVSFVYLVA